MTDNWRIVSVDVGGLLGRNSLHWALHPKVNILGGPNGSGKSTLLHALALVFSTENDDESRAMHFEVLFDDLFVQCKSGSSILLCRKCETSREKVQTDELALTEKVLVKVRDEISFEVFRNISKNKNVTEFPSKVVYINAADAAIRTYSKYIETTKQGRRLATTALDLLLEETLNTRNRLFAGRLTVAMQNNDEEELTRLRQLFSRFDTAVARFMPSYRLLDAAALRFCPVDRPDMDILYFQMSAGEKQLLYLLLSVTNTLGESTLLLLDEADLGMHIDWKRMLLRELLDINPDMQIIAATHSPSLIDGWYGSVKEISELYINDSEIPERIREALRNR